MSATPPGDPVREKLLAILHEYFHDGGYSISQAADDIQALQAVQPSPLVWTREKPTKEGWYWMRWKRSGGEIIRIHSGKYGLHTQDENGHAMAYVEEQTWLWAGPIPEPEALPKEGA